MPNDYLPPHLMTPQQKYDITQAAWVIYLMHSQKCTQDEALDVMATWSCIAQVELEKMGWPATGKEGKNASN